MNPNDLSFFDAFSALHCGHKLHLAAGLKSDNATLQTCHVNIAHPQYCAHALKPDAPTATHFSVDIAQRPVNWSPINPHLPKDVNGYRHHKLDHLKFAWSLKIQICVPPA